MKKIKFKKLFFFFLSLLSFLQLSYLILRTHYISVLGLILIIFFNIIISCLLVFNLKKFFKDKKIERKRNCFVAVISLIFTTLLFIFNFSYFSMQYRNSIIEIDTEKINDNVIDSLVLNNTIISVDNDKFLDNGIEVKIKELEIEKYDNRIIFKFGKLKNISINFKNIKGFIKVKDGKNFTKISLEDISYYKVQSNTFRDNFFVIRGLLSFVSIVYIFYIIFIYVFSIDNKSKKIVVLTILSVSLIGVFYFINTSKCILYNDSSSYINYKFSDLFHLKLSGRTPIYPLVIRIFSKLFNDSYLYFVCLFQYAFWFISIVFLNKTFRLIFKKEKLISLFTVLYALSPSIVGWNNAILTESLALSGTLIFLYYAIKYIRNPSFISGVIAIGIAFVLTFHRPTSIIYVLFLEIFWVAKFVFERKNINIDFKCFIVSTISIIVIIIYAILFHRTYGIYSISDAVVRQDLYVSIQEGYYKSSDNTEFIDDIDQMLSSKKSIWQTVYFILDKYKFKEIKRLTSYCRKQNLDNYVEYVKDLVKDHTNRKYYSYSFKVINKSDNLFQNTIEERLNLLAFFHSYLVVIVELVLIFYRWIKDKKVPWLHFGIFGMILVIVMSSFIGTCAEFMRTAICALPFTYFALTIYVVNFFDKNVYLK